MQFADDSQFLLSSKTEYVNNVVEQVEKTVTHATNHFSENGLKVN